MLGAHTLLFFKIGNPCLHYELDETFGGLQVVIQHTHPPPAGSVPDRRSIAGRHPHPCNGPWLTIPGKLGFHDHPGKIVLALDQTDRVLVQLKGANHEIYE